MRVRMDIWEGLDEKEWRSDVTEHKLYNYINVKNVKNKILLGSDIKETLYCKDLTREHHTAGLTQPLKQVLTQAQSLLISMDFYTGYSF